MGVPSPHRPGHQAGEMLIARRAAPDPAALADPGVPLKSLLRVPAAA